MDSFKRERDSHQPSDEIVFMSEERVRHSKIILWDLPARMTHWGLALSSTAALFLGLNFPPSSTPFKFHILAGMFSGWFVLVRISLCFLGSRHLRWRGLFFKPSETLKYFVNVLLWKGREYPGLNPGSAIFALAFYVFLSLGIYTGFVPDLVEVWHGRLSYGLLALICVHLLGLFIHALRNRAATPLSMVHGMGKGEVDHSLASTYPMTGLVILLTSLLVVFFVCNGYDENGSCIRIPWVGELSIPIGERG
jgi:cytochrome b